MTSTKYDSSYVGLMCAVCTLQADGNFVVESERLWTLSALVGSVREMTDD